MIIMEKLKQMTFTGLGQEESPKPFAFALKFTLDRLFIYSIIGLIAVVLIFSLGVEQGKKIAAQKIEHALMDTVSPAADDTLSTDRTPRSLSPKANSPAVGPRSTASKEPALLLPASVIEEPARTAPSVKKETNAAVPSVRAAETAASGAIRQKKTAYYIQLVSYSNEPDAVSLATKLKAEGYAASVNVRGKYKAVVIGNFSSRSEAEKVLSALRKKYHDAFVRRKEL